jgi:cation:H+ antiporter
MMRDFAVVLGGALAILLLAEIVVRQTLRIAHHLGLSGTFVGLTVLSIGTSLLEISVHIMGSVRILREPAAMDTVSALVIGSNIGSDIFQQNIVLPVIGLAAVVVVAERELVVEVGGLIVASALLWFACLGGTINRHEGILLVLAYAAYLTFIARRNARGHVARMIPEPARAHPALAGTVVVLCFAGMAAIADPVLDAASRLVERLPVSASLFGVVVLGTCAALPELMTALVAVSRGEREISAGILIGSNITNPLFSAGLGAAISGYTVPAVVIGYDLPVKIATGALLYAFLRRGSRLSPTEALVLIAAYAAYVLSRGVLFPGD